MKTGDILKKVREDAGLTQLEAATFVGISRSNWANYECNRYRPPIDIIQKFISHKFVRDLRPKIKNSDYFYPPKSDDN